MPRRWKWGLFATGLLIVLGVIGLVWPVELIFYILFGWILYLRRVLPEVEFDWATFTMFLVALGAFGIGLHGFFRWLFDSFGTIDVEDATDRTSNLQMNSGHWKASWTTCLVVLVLMLFVSGICAVGVVHQLAWWATSPVPTFDGGAREAASRNQSLSQLKQVGIGVDAFSEQHGALMPGATADKQGQLLQGWQAHLLPFVEEEALFDSIEWDKPWNDPANAKPSRTYVEVFSNPQTARSGYSELDAGGYPLSDYASNEHVIGGTRRMHVDAITDGTSRTIMAGEVIENRKPWASPANWRDPSLGINRNPRGFGANWGVGGAQFLYADGHVGMINEDIDPEVLRALATPAGGEEFPAQK